MENTIYTHGCQETSDWRVSLLFLALGGVFVCLSWSLWQHQQPYQLPRHSFTAPQVQPERYIAVDMTITKTPLVPDRALALSPAEKRQDIKLRHSRAMAAAVAQPEQERNTLALAGHVVRVLVKEEVDSFLQRAQLITEVSEHFSR